MAKSLVVLCRLWVFDRTYCDLLQEVWSRVPVVWQGGLPSLRPRPLLHKCRVGSPVP